MIPDLNSTSKEKKPNKIIIAILGIILVLSSISFTALGIFNLLRAFFTEYNLTTLDLLYFISGILLLFSIAIVNLLTEIRDQNKTIAKGVIHLLKNKANGIGPKPAGSFGDILKNLFGKQPGMDSDDVKGSISLYDVTDPDNPIFEGDFKNAEEMNDMRKNLIDKMLNSQKEFKGKKMTKQEMLNELSVRELKAELKIAVDAEDWLWAASIRDKIAEKDVKKKGGTGGSEKKDNPEL
jgi:hypothetical protein